LRRLKTSLKTRTFVGRLVIGVAAEPGAEAEVTSGPAPFAVTGRAAGLPAEAVGAAVRGLVVAVSGFEAHRGVQAVSVDRDGGLDLLVVHRGERPLLSCVVALERVLGTHTDLSLVDAGRQIGIRDCEDAKVAALGSDLRYGG